MKNIFLISILVSIMVSSYAQGIQDDITSYLSDSNFAIHNDSICSNYVNIAPLNVFYEDPESCTMIIINDIDYYISSGNSVCNYVIRSVDNKVQYQKSFTINNQTTNDMIGYMMFGLKFAYWKIGIIANLKIN